MAVVAKTSHAIFLERVGEVRGSKRGRGGSHTWEEGELKEGEIERKRGKTWIRH